MKVLIKMQNVQTVQLFTRGFTDILAVYYEDGKHRTWSVCHYEESYTQRERCRQLERAYQDIYNAIKKGESLVEFTIDD